MSLKEEFFKETNVSKNNHSKIDCYIKYSQWLENKVCALEMELLKLKCLFGEKNHDETKKNK